MNIYPYVVVVAGILLGWRLNLTRLVFAILILALADRSLLHFGLGACNDGIMATGVGRSDYHVVAFLLPLNLAVLPLMKERGLVTLPGMVRMSVIFLQVLAVFLIYRYPELGIAGPLDYMLSKASVITSLPLSLPALVAFAAAFLLLVLRFIQSEGALENGFFWALLSAFIALALTRIGAQSTV